MDSNTNVLFSRAPSPHLYQDHLKAFLKACRYVFHAISHKTEGRLATATPGCGQQKHSAHMGNEGHTEVCKQIKGNPTEQYGGGTQRSPGSIFYQEGGKTYTSLPMEMLQNIQKSPLFEKMQKDCKAEGIKIPKTIMAKDPVTHMLTPQEYL